jgi:mannosyltransferase OCH1-like enzyme
MFLHQILINDSKVIPKVLPNYTNFCTNELKRIYSNFHYKLWSYTDLDIFIKNFYDSYIYNAFLKLKPYSYKADLAKYCLLNHYGGLYVDLNTRFINPINDLNNNFFAFRDYHLSQRYGWYVSSSIMCSNKKNSILKTCLDLIISNVTKNFYGNSPLDITGPGILGQAVIKNDKAKSNINGELICLTPIHSFKTLAFVQDCGNIVAFFKPNSPGDLSFFGFEGVNNYKTMWENKDIYHDT